MKNGLRLLFLMVALLTLSACTSGKVAKESGALKKTVTVGLDDTFVPMGFRDKDGNITGFDVDLAKAVFALDKTNVVFQSIDWSMKETELRNGTIDMIWNGYTKTPERAKRGGFSESYMKNSQILVTRKDSGITSEADMNGKILGAQEGSSGYGLFTSEPKVLKDRVKGKDATLYSSFNEAFIDLDQKRIDGLLVDKIYAEYILNQKGILKNYNIIDTSYTKEDFAVGVRKGDKALADKINKGITTLKENGTYDKLINKWFGEEK